MTPLVAFIFGALSFGTAVAALFFLRFWRQTHDRLFAYFAAAFCLLAIERLAMVVTATHIENVAWLYTIRLTAFVLIIIAIVDKNRRAPR
jgi:hypothetical protein